MAVVTITSFADATGSGWTPLGSGTNWYAEKQVQCGGKWLATSSASADLITAMQNIENAAESFGTHGPKSTSYPGHV